MCHIAIILTCIKDEDIIDNSLFAISFSTAKNDQKLAKLCRGVTISRRWWRAVQLLLPAGGRCLNHFTLGWGICLLWKSKLFWENILAAKVLTFGTVLTLIIFQPNSTISEVWFGRPSPSSPCTLGCPEMNDYIAIFYLLCGGTIFIKLSSVLYKIYTLFTLKKFAPLFLLYF